MRCPICGNQAYLTRVYRCAQCGQIYCLTPYGARGREAGCHYDQACPRCWDRRTILIGECNRDWRRDR